MKAARILGVVLLSLLLMYPLSTGPMMRFYVHAYQDEEGRIGAPLDRQDQTRTLNAIYDPLWWSLGGSETVNRIFVSYYRLWLPVKRG
jgi:hypothetical protein